MITTKKDIYDTVTAKNQTYKQKILGCMGLSRNSLDPIEYLGYTEEDVEYLEKEYICDLGEGHVIFTPRYSLPNYKVFVEKGCKYLELEPPEDLDELLNGLLILYMNTPSNSGLPPYVGDLDVLIQPFLTNDEEDYKKIKRFLHHIDKTVPTSFCHAVIGPYDTKAGRLILRASKELNSPTPNLTLRYDQSKTSDEFANLCLETALLTAKPSFANEIMYKDEMPDYGVASCYNILPIGGGGTTLVRLKLGTIARDAKNVDEFINNTLPKVIKSMAHIMDMRTNFLYEKSNFFDVNFMVEEGFLQRDKFVGMFGMVGLADATNQLLKLEGKEETFGQSARGDEIAKEIMDVIDSLVNSHKATHSEGFDNKYLLHAQVGTSHRETDCLNTPAHRIKVGQEPDLPEHILSASLYQKYFKAGTGDLFNFDQTYLDNTDALLDIIKGGFKEDIRYISPYLLNSDLVRVTGYLVKRSEVEKVESGEAVYRDTATFGAGMERVADVLTGRKLRSYDK